MDSQIKTGTVYLRPHKPGKKWKPWLLSLFPKSTSGVGRLEFQDIGGGGGGGEHGVRRHHQPHSDRKIKVVRLSELISVLRLPPNAEDCPMENMSAFCVETQDRTMVFATFKDDCVDWIEKLCVSTFQQSSPSGPRQLHMEENQIYASADDVSQFWVVVQRTEAASRCGLQGSYWLQVGSEALLLRETQKKSIVHQWPYELLRRYGRDKLALTIEAGRRCDSGPGSFTFETHQAEKIFSMIQSSIRQKTSSVKNQDREKVHVTTIRARSPLPDIPAGTSMASILDNKLRMQERNVAALEDRAHPQEHSTGPAECASTQPAPVTLMPLPLVPTQENHRGGHLGGQAEAVYANETEGIQPEKRPQSSMALYVDPASILPLTPPQSRKKVAPSPQNAHPCFDDQADSVYSEVFDKISPVQIQQTAACFAEDEPIYTEPMSKEEEVHRKDESKPDPFAHLYAQVCKTTPSSSASSSPNTLPTCLSSPVSTSMSTTNTTDCLDDVIYENLGVI
ncbi:LOW QUALITY PROTEIN: docking protein 1-like [Brachionichthys hirsutus]|uniref:LOW QUALITY PROTEIN: docking protein 1-like n=1 Tax=Brachionichthys hirsutus TaxID=412623 RepID=UPI0036049D72